MLADLEPTAPKAGALEAGVAPDTSHARIFDFVASQLPKWRDAADRKSETAETRLTDQLCDYLNGAVRKSDVDFLQFRTEVPDESVGGRSIDLAVKPCGARVWIEGRSYTQFEVLAPIECKRLPTPKGPDRDEREYVFSQFSTTGGIQRFKLGAHGAAHRVAGMIGYLQADPAEAWRQRIDGWIAELAKSDSSWHDQEHLSWTLEDASARLFRLKSRHSRGRGLSEILLEHLWVQMSDQ